MSRPWFLLLCLLIHTACDRPAPAGPVDEDTLAELRAIKGAIVQGHRTRDRASLDTLYPEDYVVTDADGEVRRKGDLLTGLAEGPEMVEGHYELHRGHRWGNMAVASGRGRMVYRSGDSTRVAEYNSVNVFERRQGRWRYVAAFVP
jgi:hypothetical protein